jgi:hypothetical protein
MAFIDELIGQGGLPYGMEIETPKAHDEIDSLIDNNLQEEIMNLVIGTVGGGGANINKIGKKVLTKIKARNAKAIRDLTSGKSTGQQTLKPQDSKWLSEQWRNWENLNKEISRAKTPGWKNLLKEERARLDPNYRRIHDLDYDPPSNMEVGTLLGSLLSTFLLAKADAIERREHGKRYGEKTGKLNIGQQPKQY